jgi:hypothetical protein
MDVSASDQRTWDGDAASHNVQLQRTGDGTRPAAGGMGAW